jgi:hypothetical protein
MKKVQVSKAVNIRDVTGVSVTTFTNTWMLIVGIILCIAIIGIPFLIAYYLTRATLLNVEYAGGGIGFDIKWFSMNECQEYQKALFLAKDKVFEGDNG